MLFFRAAKVGTTAPAPEPESEPRDRGEEALSMIVWRRAKTEAMLFFRAAKTDRPSGVSRVGRREVGPGPDVRMTDVS